MEEFYFSSDADFTSLLMFDGAFRHGSTALTHFSPTLLELFETELPAVPSTAMTMADVRPADALAAH